MTSADGTLMKVNPAFAEMLGYTVLEMTGDVWTKLTHPDDIQESKDFVGSILRGERESAEFEKRYIHKDGHLVWVSIGTRLFRDSAGEPLYFITSIQDITDRKRTEEELQKSEERLREAQRVGQLGSLDWNLVTNEIVLSEEALNIYGFDTVPTLDEIVSILHPEDKERVEESLNNAIKGIAKHDIEHRMIRPDGETVFVRATAELFFDSGGKPARLLGTILDITDRETIEVALLESQQELALRNRIANAFLTETDEGAFATVLEIILETMDSPFGVVGYINENNDLVVQTMNRHIWDKCDVLEKDIVFPRETWGNSSWPTVLRENRVVCSNKPSNLIPQGHIPIKRNVAVPINFRNKVIGLLQVANKNDDYNKEDMDTFLSISNYISPILNARIERDILSEKRLIMIEQLKQSEAKFRSTFEQATVGIAHVAPDGKWLNVNKRLCDIIGYTEDELLKLTFHDITHPDDLDADLSNVQMLLDGEIKTYSMEKRYIRKDNSIVWINLSVSLVRGENNIPLYFVSVVEDIHAKKMLTVERDKLNEQITKKNDELEQIVFATSHDLRSPLLNIQGFSLELKSSLQELNEITDATNIEDNIKQKITGITKIEIPDALKFIEISSAKMDSLLSGLLKLSRLGRVKHELKQINMNKVLEDVAGALEHRLKDIGGRLMCENLPDCWGDEVQLNQVFTNLIDNAIKYRDPERPLLIKVGATVEKENIKFTVEDSGLGIDEDHQEIIFEIFHRLNPGKAIGEGLGLTIIRRILQRHNGKITVKSELGKGSRFIINLPKQEQGKLNE